MHNRIVKFFEQSGSLKLYVRDNTQFVTKDGTCSDTKHIKYRVTRGSI